MLIVGTLATVAIIYIPIAATHYENVIVALIAAVASILNTWILIRSRQVQRAHKQTSDNIKSELTRIRVPIDTLRELSEIRENHIDELKGINRALSNRAIELREVSEALRMTFHDKKTRD